MLPTAVEVRKWLSEVPDHWLVTASANGDYINVTDPDSPEGGVSIYVGPHEE